MSDLTPSGQPPHPPKIKNGIALMEIHLVINCCEFWLEKAVCLSSAHVGMSVVRSCVLTTNKQVAIVNMPDSRQFSTLNKACLLLPFGHNKVYLLLVNRQYLNRFKSVYSRWNIDVLSVFFCVQQQWWLEVSLRCQWDCRLHRVFYMCTGKLMIVISYWTFLEYNKTEDSC